MFSGVAAAGVRVAFTVVDWPGFSVIAGGSPPTVSPAPAAREGDRFRHVADRGEREGHRDPRLPGSAAHPVGFTARVTPWTAGMVNVTCCVLVTAGLVVLVAVTSKVTTVPGAGSGPPVGWR